MGFDWETILNAEGADIADAWEDAVYDAIAYEKEHRLPCEYGNY